MAATADASGLTLAPGKSVTCTALHTVTQGEMDAGGKLTNVATATSKESRSATDSLEIAIFQKPALTLDKVGVFQDGDGDKFADVGELISYSFLVKNIGNVTLSNISVKDPNVSSISCPVVGNPIPTLAVGASQTCTGSYAITQADIDAGQKLNTALASGEGPQGQPASDEDRQHCIVTAEAGHHHREDHSRCVRQQR